MFGISTMGYENNMKSSGEDLLSAVKPLMKLLSLTVIGLVLAHPKTQIIPKATFKLLSKLVFALFLPCLIFIHLGESITLDNVALWWFIPVNVLVSTIIGCILGYLVVVICRPPPQFTRFTIIMTAFGNTGNLPLAIVGSVCHTSDNPFGPDCHRKGVAYVSFAQWVAVILVYTLVYHMMEPPLEYYEVVEEGGDIEEAPSTNDVSRPLLVEAEWPGIEDKETEHSKKPFIARVFNSLSSVSQTNFPDLDLSGEKSGNSPKSIRCLAEPRVVRRFRIVAEQTPIQHILQPPTIASLFAIIVGMVPQIRTVVFGDDAPLLFITDSLEILAGAMVPSVMLILGGMLAEGPNDSALGLRTTIGISVARLLVLPLLGIGIVTLADKLNFLVHGDQMYKFVLLLQYTMPSAILLGAIASLRGYAVSEASALLFWQHVFALFSLSLYVVLYFKMLSAI
ncbi:protein PIN-LIKES 2 [Malania oleifera]|uniref:protein PIN-LIKES 2 n=1 Tax=Malania oleifera TaxID=397392 RepID=UPI0025AEA461|nr:protein PIN-LIKES 2 [Malania oleifera]XP_057961169.1 protein PIN-LIKES 2 [Malania oleifera]XP_057961170.1 protein PIN-LIKES 2 [Malania oleifera]XP_057961171.1 protein PIN-LIKES 2 [Malania oleifera]XP_057961173.1 protein PIN-LIKES 2 [Malania oleifera]XP_057961174.1 protein PIN-LIKES 2 [Malania oleifera]